MCSSSKIQKLSNNGQIKEGSGERLLNVGCHIKDKVEGAIEMLTGFIHHLRGASGVQCVHSGLYLQRV